MTALFHAVDRVSQYLGLSASHFYLLCALMTVYEVVMRYFFKAPTQWAFEVVMVVCASAWMLSGPYVTMRKRHIGITVLYQMSKGRARWFLDLFINVCQTGAMAILCYATINLAEHAIAVIERSGSAFNSPEPFLLKILLTFCTGLYTLQALVNLIRHLGEAPAVFGGEG